MNTIKTFIKRQDARDFSKSVSGKVIDLSKDQVLEAGEDRWAVMFVEEVIEDVQEVQPVQPEVKREILTIKRKVYPVTKNFSTVTNRKGNTVNVTHKRSRSVQIQA